MKNNHVNETRTMKCGEAAKIVVYENADCIIVEFEDGTRKMSRYSNFTDGRISPNKYDSVWAKERIGTYAKLKSGERALCIQYRNCNDIDICCGKTIIKHVRWNSFIGGHVDKTVRYIRPVVTHKNYTAFIDALHKEGLYSTQDRDLVFGEMLKVSNLAKNVKM